MLFCTSFVANEVKLEKEAILVEKQHENDIDLVDSDPSREVTLSEKILKLHCVRFFVNYVSLRKRVSAFL